METLPSSSGGDKSPFMEKLIRYGVPIGLCVAGFWFWGQISAFVAATLQDTLKTVVYGVLTAAVVLPMLLYPKFIWMGYKTILHKIMSFFIKLDPLSFMDRYVDILSEKLASLNTIRVTLKGKKVEAERRLADLTHQVEDNLKKGAAAKKMNDLNTASLCGTRAQGAQQSIMLYTPNYQRMTKSLDFLDTLAENWGMSIIKLREEVARKREEFEVLKADAAALNQAEAFLNGDTEEGRIYQESLKALEDSVTHKIAYIEDFENRSKDILAGIKVENQMQHDEGLSMLDQYMHNGTLMLPDDYSKPVKVPVQDVQFEDVSKSTFNLLK